MFWFFTGAWPAVPAVGVTVAGFLLGWLVLVFFFLYSSVNCKGMGRAAGLEQRDTGLQTPVFLLCPDAGCPCSCSSVQALEAEMEAGLEHHGACSQQWLVTGSSAGNPLAFIHLFVYSCGNHYWF